MNKTAAFAITLLFATALGAEDAQKLKPIPEKLVVLTFDDGNVSDRTVVAPILKEQGFGATFYITAGWVGRRGRVTWQQVRELDEMGFEIGNHTTTHPNMLHISEEEIRSQIAGFDRALREQGIQRATTFAYPGEHHDRRIVRALAKAGYTNARRGVTPEFPLHDRGGPGSVYNPLDEDPFLIPSVYCRGDLSPSREEFSRALDQARGGKISVFIYHGVPDVHAHCTTSLELFKRDMQHLKDEGCTVIAMRDLAKYVDFSKRQKDIYAPIIARLGITTTDLKCDTSGDTPVFSWKTKTTRPQTHSAYQLLVASSPEKLAINQADLWDSGKVKSDRTT
ncbi:MAG: polysaccharide deacetylase family protein, partial [Limisphaerales bacterium]